MPSFRKSRSQSSLTPLQSQTMSGHLGNLSPEQQEKLDRMRAKLETIPPPYIDIKNELMGDREILRFLRARQFDFDKSFEMIQNMLKFRHEFQGISVAAVHPINCDNELKAAKSFFHGMDKKGRPVTYVRARLHDPSVTDALENQRFTILQMEFGRTIMPPDCETATIVFDMSGTTLKNIDMASTKFMVNTFSNHYPETLGAVLVYDAPWIVNGVWKAVKPWLDPVTASKVVFINKGTLHEHIPTEHLLPEYGGTSTYKYDYEKYKEAVEQAIPLIPNAHTPNLKNSGNLKKGNSSSNLKSPSS